MASALYTAFKDALMKQSPSIDIDDDTIKCALVNTGTDYAFSAAHDFLDDVTRYSGTTDQALSNKTVSGGVFDNTADLTFSAVAIDGAKTVDAVVIYKDTGVPGTSPLICYLELAVSVTPNGGDIVIQFNASGILAL